MNIKQLRERLSLTQSQFAALIGLSSKGHVSELERGEPCSVRVALEVEKLAGGEIDAAALNPDVALVRSAERSAS